MKMKLADIRIDGGTQPRVAIDQEVVDDYAAAAQDGAKFPPADVFHDGVENWLADGFHRYLGHQKAGLAEIDVAVHAGTRRDAILFSLGANGRHGLRRSNDDKRKSVQTLLDDPEWREWSNVKIAETAGVSEAMVRGLRGGPDPGEAAPTRLAERNGKPYRQAVGRNGTPKPPPEADFGDGDADDDVRPPGRAGNAPNAATDAGDPGENGSPADPAPPAAHAGNGAAKSRGSTDAPPTDEVGNVIHRPEVAEVFASRNEMQDKARRLREVLNEVLAALERSDPLYAHVNPTALKTAVSNAVRTILFGLPYALCPYHDPDDETARAGCKACKGHGWVTPDVYDQAPKSMKKAKPPAAAAPAAKRQKRGASR